MYNGGPRLDDVVGQHRTRAGRGRSTGFPAAVSSVPVPLAARSEGRGIGLRTSLTRAQVVEAASRLSPAHSDSLDQHRERDALVGTGR